MRVRLELAYDGGAFSGWAAQPGLRTVEQVLTDGLRQVTRAPDVSVVVAGRTDAGVHARGQVCHVDIPDRNWRELPGRSDRPPGPALLRRLVGVLPPDIAVRGAVPAAPGFHARFAALARRYVYRVCDDPAAVDPLRRAEVLMVHRPVDVETMNAATHMLLGLRDFAAFCQAREGATTVRALHEFSWRRVPPGEVDAGLVTATVVADAFCRSMVRSLVGAALAVGRGRHDAGWPAMTLAGRRRNNAAQVAPAHGLTLEEVSYPHDAGLAARVREARAVRVLPS